MATDPRRLAFLLAVHRAGGVLAAADLMHVTPSAVSQQIARLEAEEKVLVLDRGPRGVSLTPAGRVLAEAAERIETELTEARRAVAALNEDIIGTVVIGSIQTAIQTVVAPVVVRLGDLLPGVDLVIEERDPAESLRLLRSGDLDIVLLERDSSPEGSEAPRGMHDAILVDEPWRLIIPAGFPTPTQLADLIDAVWLGPQADSAGQRALRRVERELGVRLTTRHVYYGFDVALSMVASGLGVAMMPALALLHHPVPDNVTVVRLPGLGSRRLVLRHRSGRHGPRPVVSAVVEGLLDQAATIELG